jgi:hypothetical protein
MHEKRRKVWIDSFQTKLSIWITVYFLLYQVIVWLVFGIGRLIAVPYFEVLPNAFAVFFGVALLTLGGVAILFIRDAIKYTHRIVGPIYRFRKAIEALKNGEDMEPIRLRDGDYLTELRDEFNEMLRVLEHKGAIRMKAGAAVQTQASVDTAVIIGSPQPELQR